MNLNIDEYKKSIHYEINYDGNINLEPRELNNVDWEKKLDFEIQSSNIQSKIIYRCVAGENVNLDLTFKLYTSPKNIDNVDIELEVYVLNISEQNNIKISPFLEIPRENIRFEHKVTVGAPSKIWLKYLNSRGLSNEAGTNLIVKSFL